MSYMGKKTIEYLNSVGAALCEDGQWIMKKHEWEEAERLENESINDEIEENKLFADRCNAEKESSRYE